VEQLARSTARQSIKDGTGASNQTLGEWDTISDTGRDSCNHSGLLFAAGV